MRALLVALSICAVAPAARTAEAKCARWGLAPNVLTPRDAAIPPDGGILVGAEDSEDGSLDDGDVAHQPGWRLRIGSRVATPTLTALAPGLVVYRLPADAVDAQLIDDKRQLVGKVTVGGKTPALAAPKLKRLRYEARLGRRASARLTVELAGPAPAGAVALVIADASGNKARSWGRVAAAGDTTVPGYDRGRCRVLPNGTIESKPGDRVTAFWVDGAGRRSRTSPPMVVTGNAPVDDGE